MTIRSEGQFNTVVYEEEDIYRGQDRRDVILINPDDMRRLGLAPDQPVTVRSAVGELRRRLARPYDIRPGNAAMYYPEANVLVPRDVDPAVEDAGIQIRARRAGGRGRQSSCASSASPRVSSTVTSILQRHQSCFVFQVH